MSFVERARKGFSKEAADKNEKRLLKVIQGKKEKREDKEKEEKKQQLKQRFERARAQGQMSVQMTRTLLRSAKYEEDEDDDAPVVAKGKGKGKARARASRERWLKCLTVHTDKPVTWMKFFFAPFADMVKPGLKSRTSVGFLCF